MVNILILTYIWRLEQITSKIVSQKKDRVFFEWWNKEFHCESSVLKFIKVSVFDPIDLSKSYPAMQRLCERRFVR
jgi:hypothetical protein